MHKNSIHHLCERLDLSPDHALPGYEDTWYYMWKERRLPVNVDPFENKLENKEDRARLARVFERGLNQEVGYALPLKRQYYTDGTSDWVTGSWFFRPERMYLIPGDSPMGFRLPLDSIPWVHPSEVDHMMEQDPMAVRRPLPERAAMAASNAGRQRYMGEVPEYQPAQGIMEQSVEMGPARERPRRRAAVLDLPPAQGQSATGMVRTALCAETRDGILRVFLPPQRYLEDYLGLVHCHRRYRRGPRHARSRRRVRPTIRFARERGQSHSRSRGDRSEPASLGKLG